MISGDSKLAIELDQRYFLELLNSDLSELALRYEAFESEVETSAFGLFLREIEQGATPQGSQLRIDGVSYHLKLDQIGTDRCLRLHLFPVGVSKPRLEHSVVSVNHFGRVREIDIEWPHEILRKHESLPERLGQLVLRFYV